VNRAGAAPEGRQIGAVAQLHQELVGVSGGGLLAGAVGAGERIGKAEEFAGQTFGFGEPIGAAFGQDVPDCDQHDDLGRMIRVTDPFTGVVEYAYDLAGNRTALTVTHDAQTTTTHYTFDADNRLLSVTDWATGTTTYGYDTAGRLITTTLPNGVQTTHTYDPAGRLTTLLHARGTTVLARYDYTLDAIGNRTHVTETVSGVTRGISYTYDALYRLTAADYSTDEAYAYQYDAAGNREVMTDTAVHTYAYDPANRLTNTDGVTYTWDNRGNLLSDGTFTYTYNAAGRMVRAESLTATLVYTYNADGLRVAQSMDGDVNIFTWDWATGVPELLSDGESTYLIGYDTLGWQTGSDWRYVLPDALGSVRQETDADGAVTAAREWSPFGEEVGGAQTGLGFTGEWQDANVGMTYLRARWYDGATGQFTQVDSWEGNVEQPLTLNPYLYALANPLNHVDPSGLCSSSASQQEVCFGSESDKAQCEILRQWICDVYNANVKRGKSVNDGRILYWSLEDMFTVHFALEEWAVALGDTQWLADFSGEFDIIIIDEGRSSAWEFVNLDKKDALGLYTFNQSGDGWARPRQAIHEIGHFWINRIGLQDDFTKKFWIDELTWCPDEDPITQYARNPEKDRKRLPYEDFAELVTEMIMRNPDVKSKHPKRSNYIINRMPGLWHWYDYYPSS